MVEKREDDPYIEWHRPRSRARRAACEVRLAYAEVPRFGRVEMRTVDVGVVS